MIVYFADRKMNILGQASTDLPTGMYLVDDRKTEEVHVGVSTFDFVLPYTQEERKKVEAWTAAGNFVLRKDGEDTGFYTVIETETDTQKQEIYVYTEDAGLDLLNDVAGVYEADREYPISHYVELFAADSGFEIGINEVKDLTRKLSWDSEETVTARLDDIAAAFDGAELSYHFQIKGLTVAHKWIHIRKARGTDAGVTLRLHQEVERIVTKRSVANLATALLVKGETPQDQEEAVTLEGYVYDDGDFYVDGALLKSRKALEKWGRYLKADAGAQGHMVKAVSYDSAEQEELFQLALEQLKKDCEPEVNYEVELSGILQGVHIGDTVRIVDPNEELYLSARVLKLEVSASNDTQTITLGDYLIKDSGIYQQVADLAAEFSKLAAARTLYTWFAYSDDAQGHGISLHPEGKAYLGTAANQLSEYVDISDPGIFEWARIQGEEGEPAVNLAVESSQGNIFKDALTSAQLKAMLSLGARQITTAEEIQQVFGPGVGLVWYLQEEKIQEPSFSDADFTVTVSAEQVEDQATVVCELVAEDETVKARGQIGLTNLSGSFEAVQEAWDKASEAQTDVAQLDENLKENYYSKAALDVQNHQLMLSLSETYSTKQEMEENSRTLEQSMKEQINMSANAFQLSFTEILKMTDELEGRMEVLSQMQKFFRFSAEGLEIGESGKALTLTLDNDKIAFKKNGDVVAHWDGQVLHTGNIQVDVNQEARFGNFAFTPRPDESLMFSRV